MKLKEYLLQFGVGSILFTAGAAATRYLPVPCGTLVFLALLCFEALIVYRRADNLLDLRLLLTLSWLFGIALSGLHLSTRQNEWYNAMWLVCGGFYFAAMGAYEIVDWLMIRRRNKKAACETAEEKMTGEAEAVSPHKVRRLEQAIITVATLGLLGFLAESLKFRFEYPILVRGTPHAYTSFHITGVHYFVVSLVFVHMLTTILFMSTELSKKKKTGYLILNGVCFLVHVLLLSKFQILVAVLMPFIILTVMQKKISKGKQLLYLAGTGVVFAIFTVIVLYSRDYPEGYLQELFHFKNENMPIAIQYPYMYIVNNFENLNVQVGNLKSFRPGAMTLFPFFALTGLKFFQKVKEFMTVQRYLTCVELSTTTILYDVYTDFSAVGTIVFGLILGGVSAICARLAADKRSVGALLFHAQFAIYLALAFFQNWFSNPTTWFWFIVTGAIGIFVRIGPKKFDEKLDALWEKLVTAVNKRK